LSNEAEVRVNHHLSSFFTGKSAEASRKVPEKFIDKLSGYLINDWILKQSGFPVHGTDMLAFIPARKAGA
jgi:hypothetical protein